MIESLAFGVHMFSIHAPKGDNTNTNPGVYAVMRLGDTKWEGAVGAYRNSQRHLTTYVAGRYEWKYAGLAAGVATGYRQRSLLPFIAPYWKINDHLRLTILPGSAVGDGATVLHLTYEF